MTYKAKIDGVIAGAESGTLQFILSLLDEIAAKKPTLIQTNSRIRNSLLTRQPTTLPVQETRDLYISIQNLGDLETVLQKNYPKFSFLFNRFRLEVETAVVGEKALVINVQPSTIPQPPPKNYNEDTNLKRLLKTFGVKTSNPQDAFKGNVLSFHDAKSDRIVIVYLDSHTGANHQDFNEAVIDTWLPAGFNLYGAENLSIQEGEWSNHRSKNWSYGRMVFNALTQCPSREPKELARQIVHVVPFSYISLECVVGGALTTFGIEDDALYLAAGQFNITYRVLPPGSYKLYEGLSKNTDDRSKAMANNLTSLMRGQGPNGKEYKKALTMIGSFHTPTFKDQLKTNKISYVEILVQSDDFNDANDGLELDGYGGYSFPESPK